MYKKLPYSKSAENLNKVASPITGHTFLGLIQVSAGSRYGFLVDRRNHCGVHLLNRAAKKPITEDPAEAVDVKNEMFYLTLITDGSGVEYIKRFKDKEAAMEWYLGCPATHITANPTLYKLQEK